MKRWRGHTAAVPTLECTATREEVPYRSSPRGTPSCCSSPLAGQFLGSAAGREAGRGPRTLGRSLDVLGSRKESPTLTCSWHWAARGAWAAGRLGTAPRHPGPAGPAPNARTRGAEAVSEATFRVRRAPRLRDPESGWQERGGRRLEAWTLRGAPTALRGCPLWLLAPTSPFPPQWKAPAFLLGPSMTHRSPRVPPSLFHFPLGNVILPPPRLPVSSPLASQQGLGVKGPKGLGEGSILQNFQLLIPLVSSQKPGNSAYHLPTDAPPQPLGKWQQPVSRSPHVVHGCRPPRVNEGHLYLSFIRGGSDFL